MIRSTIYFFLIIIVFSSCKKTKLVNFHGRVTLECNQQPVRNCSVQIHRYYDTGSHQAEFVVAGSADNNGYYSMSSEVGENGSFMSYALHVIPTGNTTPYLQNLQGFESYNNSNNVQIDGQYRPARAYNFHIKNTSPFNNNDVFNSLIRIRDYLHLIYTDTIITNLYGSTVDQNIVIFLDPLFFHQLFYKYSFTKNGITTSSSLDSIAPVSCLDTARVDIFY